MLETHKKRKIQ